MGKIFTTVIAPIAACLAFVLHLTLGTPVDSQYLKLKHDKNTTSELLDNTRGDYVLDNGHTYTNELTFARYTSLRDEGIILVDTFQSHVDAKLLMWDKKVSGPKGIGSQDTIPFADEERAHPILRKMGR